MRNIIIKREGEAAFVTWIKKRIAHNLNFICLFQGPTGIGKTWAAISMAEQIDPEFCIDQVVFDFHEFLNVLNADWFKEKTWRIIIWDEPQITISNRNWQSAVNKMMNYVLSTFRHKNVVLIFCSPYKDFLDSQSMKLLHCLFKCQGVNTKKKLSNVRPLLQEYNSDMKKFYQHKLFVGERGRKITKLKTWKIPIPSKNIIDSYEAKKTLFTDELNKDIRNQVEEMDKIGQKPDRRKKLTEKQEKVLTLLAEGKRQREIADMFGITGVSVSNIKRDAEKKGYEVSEFKKEAIMADMPRES